MAGGQNPKWMTDLHVVPRFLREHEREMAAERARTTEAKDGPAEASNSAAATRGAVGRPCWIVDERPGKWPALLIEWHRDLQGQWWGRVLTARQDGGRITTTDRWVEAKYLQPLE